MRHILSIMMLSIIPLLIVACGAPEEQQTGANPNMGNSGGVEENENDTPKQTETTLSDIEIRKEATVKEDRVQFTIRLTNESEQSITLPFSSGQQFEIVVHDENGNEAYRYSEGMMFTQALENVEVEAGATREWHDEWDRTIQGEEADPGEYEWTAEIIVAEDGEEYGELTTEAETFTIE